MGIRQNEAQIKAYQKQLTNLQNNIKAYESILNIHRKNWDTYQKLEVMKFGIDELQQLWLTVSEIARNRGDPLKDFDMIENPVAFFIKDVEENYYNKLKFEDRVKEKRNELATLNAATKHKQTKSLYAANHRTFTSFSLPERYY